MDRDRKLEIDLKSQILDRAAVMSVLIRGEHAGKDGTADTVQIKGGRTDIRKAEGRKVEFARRFQEVAAVQRIDAEAWEAVIVAISLDVAIVDIIVAERSEIEIVEGVVSIAFRCA